MGIPHQLVSGEADKRRRPEEGGKESKGGQGENGSGQMRRTRRWTGKGGRERSVAGNEGGGEGADVMKWGGKDRIGRV